MKSKVFANTKLLSLAGVKYLIVDQFPLEPIFNSDKIEYFSMNERGLSKSRNFALTHAEGDILVIADDDIWFVDDFSKLLDQHYLQYPDADFITFNNICDVSPPQKSYQHNLKSVLGISSWKISFKKSSFQKMGMQFDERFGLGSDFIAGEENIFLFEALKNGLVGYHVAAALVCHQDLSTGYKYNDKLALTKGAIQARLLGRLAYLTAFITSLRKYSEYRGQITYCKFLTNIFKGVYLFRSRANSRL